MSCVYVSIIRYLASRTPPSPPPPPLQLPAERLPSAAKLTHRPRSHLSLDLPRTRTHAALRPVVAARRRGRRGGRGPVRTQQRPGRWQSTVIPSKKGHAALRPREVSRVFTRARIRPHSPPRPPPPAAPSNLSRTRFHALCAHAPARDGRRRAWRGPTGIICQ
jgi:hypothetical protein